MAPPPKKKTWGGVMMENDSQLVFLLFQILNRLVLLFQRFVRGKNLRGVQLKCEGMFPRRKDLLSLARQTCLGHT